MAQADPWDEIPRLEKQMEAELLSRLARSGLRGWNVGARTEPAVTSKARPPEAKAGPPEA
jgi:hypothetical protein